MGLRWRDQHHYLVIAACHARKIHVAPSIPAPRHPVFDIAQPTPKLAYCIAQSR
jgi:hypothetical protein